MISKYARYFNTRACQSEGELPIEENHFIVGGQDSNTWNFDRSVEDYDCLLCMENIKKRF